MHLYIVDLHFSSLVLAKRVTFQVFVYLVHIFFLFFYLSFKKPLKNLKRMRGKVT